VYSLPFGRGQRWLSAGSPAIDYAFGGWQASTVVTFQSGRPVSTGTTDSLASFTGTSDRAFAVAGVSPTAKTDGNTGLGTRTPQNWFNTAGLDLRSFASSRREGEGGTSSDVAGKPTATVPIAAASSD
jgi:hypothetical protein